MAAEAALARHYGVSKTAIAPILDAAFEGWGDEAALLAWVRGELGSETALDAIGVRGERMARGPELVAMLTAAGVPTTPVGDIISGLLVKAPVWVKIASGADDLAIRFVESLATEDELLGRVVEVAAGRPDDDGAERWLEAASTVVATGRRETLETIRRRLRHDQRWIEHGPRQSVAMISRSRLLADSEGVVRRLARDVAFSGQLGCLSPTVAYAESGPATLTDLASRVLSECHRLWPSPPERRVSMQRRAELSEARAALEIGSAAGALRRFATVDSGWTVVVPENPVAPEPPPLPLCLTLVGVSELLDVPALLETRRGTMATVGLEASLGEVQQLVPGLLSAGVERVTALGRMQRPPVDWRRDGRPTLADLVTWVDLETR